MTSAFITVLTNTKYLPGALTLGHSLRDFETRHKLAILVAGVSKDAIKLLKDVFDDVIDVQPILSTSLEQLNDLGRVDLVATYTKILIWKQTQYDKIIYLDSDVLPLASLDSFFDVEIDEEYPIAASPDAGWPDIFNSGVFITIPSNDTFNELMKLIQTSVSPSFDGGDQGLLNEFFLGSWKRLPFTFNVTPTAGYQYVPAFLRFKNDIKNIHFIGLNKPWLTRDSSIFAHGSFGKGYDIMTEFHQTWWSVFNKHYIGEIAGEIYQLSNTKSIEDVSDQGEGHLLDIPQLTNQWDKLTISDKGENDVDETQEIPAIFPWEGKRSQAERVFDQSTDFHV